MSLFWFRVPSKIDITLLSVVMSPQIPLDQDGFSHWVLMTLIVLRGTGQIFCEVLWNLHLSYDQTGVTSFGEEDHTWVKLPFLPHHVKDTHHRHMPVDLTLTTWLWQCQIAQVTLCPSFPHWALEGSHSPYLSRQLHSSFMLVFIKKNTGILLPPRLILAASCVLFTSFSWRIIALQCYVGFYHTKT